ncbi:hypothetical protein [Mycoplasma sp. Mirounga ES2805-ORL]|uniref:hypothetical protein n=1 Tax=Mycoplasma sp. Mirounga ES2805-ORL TaxID=754514 RepID=UPI00197C3437|nr:hypothetical protein [Mycoplasma sp. Mirounga ES2805-ORL]QSF13755.1 hypothetical protein JXZ90_00430 [Mycoplasma sp. Mirounga ES2805-ORL]
MKFDKVYIKSSDQFLSLDMICKICHQECDKYDNYIKNEMYCPECKKAKVEFLYFNCEPHFTEANNSCHSDECYFKK